MGSSTNGKGSGERLPWLIAGAAVLALVASLLWDREGGDAVDREALARLEQRLEAVESAPGPARRRAPVSAAPGPYAGASGGDIDDPTGLDGGPRTPEEIAAERERQLRELEARFAADVADPATAPATEDLLVRTISGEAMAGTGLRPDNVDIACKQSSCRIVGSFDRMGDAQDWGLFYITAAGGNVLGQTRMLFVPRPGGKTEVRIYSERAKD